MPGAEAELARRVQHHDRQRCVPENLPYGDRQASARSTALRQIADNPSRISALMLEARIFGASLGPERMPRRIQAESRNDNASSSIANGP